MRYLTLCVRDLVKGFCGPDNKAGGYGQLSSLPRGLGSVTISKGPLARIEVGRRPAAGGWCAPRTGPTAGRPRIAWLERDDPGAQRLAWLTRSRWLSAANREHASSGVP